MSLGNNESDKIQLKRLSHAAIGVRDLAGQADFYEARVFKPLSLNHVVLFAGDLGKQHLFGFIALPRRGLQHAAFDLRGRAELWEAIVHLGDAGFKRVDGPGRHGPGNMLFTYFEDPERNLLELCTEIQQIHAASHHPRAWDADSALNISNTSKRLGPPSGFRRLLPVSGMISKLSRHVFPS
jgi:catechol 2,3-dioxygenase-like lactoylglutathione lyase family enzyme